MLPSMVEVVALLLVSGAGTAKALLCIAFVLLTSPTGAHALARAAHKAGVPLSDRTVTEAMRAMQREHRGCVLVTDDGTDRSKLTGIFTERDVLFRIVDRGRNPASLPVGEVMTPDPDTLPVRANVAYKQSHKLSPKNYFPNGSLSPAPPAPNGSSPSPAAPNRSGSALSAFDEGKNLASSRCV